MMKLIADKIDELHKEIKDILMEKYNNLYFFITPTGNLTAWVRTPEGKDGAGIEMKHIINVGSILPHHEKYLDELNEYVAPVHNEPDKYFYCTECGQVKPKEEFADSVFAGYYCKDCANKPQIAKLIKESHTQGFYD